MKSRALFTFVGIVAGLFAGACSGEALEPENFELQSVQTLVGNSGIWNGLNVPVSSQALGNFKTQVDDLVATTAINHNIPGMTVAITRGGRLVYSAGVGYASWSSQAPMQPWRRSRMGSSNKVLTALAMMKLIEDRADLTTNTRVYGNNGILSSSGYSSSYIRGTNRHFPLVGLAIGRDNRVVAWYSDGVYTVGSSEDLGQYEGPQSFSLPPGQSFGDIVDIARGGADNRVFSWYRDGSYAVGTPSDLDAFQYVNANLPNVSGFVSRGRTIITSIAVDTRANIFYAYYHDGKVTSGTSPANLTDRWTQDYTVPGDPQRRYDIVGVDRSDNGVMVVWYSDELASKGNATNLASISNLYSYERRGVTNSRAQWHTAYNNMEIRHLLSHTAGFWGGGEAAQAALMFGFGTNVEANPIPYEFSNRYLLATRALLFKPGQGNEYSNHGMGLVGHLIEEETGQSWYDYLRANILVPAGAGSIYPFRMDVNPSLDSSSHTVNSETLVVTTHGHPNPLNHPGSAAGSLKASAIDLARVLVATDRLPNHPDVLSSDSLDLMESRPFPEVAGNRAHGWGINCPGGGACPSYRLWHNGSANESLSTGRSTGASYIAKYSNYTVNGTPINGITVSIVINRPSSAGLGELANSIARAVQLGTVPPFGDLFDPLGLGL